MSSIVAVAGGSGGLGRAIVETLVADGRYKVIVLSRAENPELEKATGARVLAADYTSVDALAKLFQENEVSTVILTLKINPDVTADLNMVRAAASSGVKRFIPNMWGAISYKPEHLQYMPFIAGRFQVMDELRKTDLEWASISNGFFLDYYVPGLHSHLEIVPIYIDVENNAAGIPGSGNMPVTFTYSYDIGKYVAALLGADKWENEYSIAGETKTWNEVLAIAEKAKGVKFKVSFDAIETLEKGQVTELPGHDKSYAAFGGRETAMPMVQGIYARFGLWMEEGLFEYQGGPALDKIFQEIKPLGMEDAWKKSGETH